MKGFRVVLVVSAVVAALLVGMGFYQGWFYLVVDKDKFREDQQGVLERMRSSEPALRETFPANEKRIHEDTP